jgi:3-phenylpropionate/trans-cinnamate dioxygenase ferredoxin reductase subunit
VDLHRSHGVEVRLGARVDGLDGGDKVERVRFRDGKGTDVDVVVMGVGARPEIDLALVSGLGTGQGVLVDSRLASSHPDVLAAGDIAEAHHPLLGRRVRVEHWANASRQGAVAGANAAGASREYTEVPYFFSNQHGSALEYSGWPLPWDRVVFRGDPADGAFVAFYLRERSLVGGASVNTAGANEHVERLIRDRGEVDVEQLSDPHVAPPEWHAQRTPPAGAAPRASG